MDAVPKFMKKGIRGELHKKVKVTRTNGDVIEVDEKLAVTLQGLWTLGIETRQSCQGVGGTGYRRGWISFSIEEAKKFALIASAPSWEWDTLQWSQEEQNVAVWFPSKEVQMVGKFVQEALTSPGQLRFQIPHVLLALEHVAAEIKKDFETGALAAGSQLQVEVAA